MGKIAISKFYDGYGFKEGVEVLDQEIISISRWTYYSRYILKLPDGRVISVHRSQGSTEMQTEDSWKPFDLGYRDEIEFEEVEKIVIWVRK